MQSFDPPGFLEDLEPQQRLAWSDWIAQQIDAARAGQPQLYDFDAPRPRFFNALTTPADGATEKDITWTAFPRLVEIDAASNEDRWRTADSTRDVQDEYCEWSVEHRDGRLARVTFTCEGPEYWEYLAAVNLAAVADLYRRFINPEVQEKDLVGTDGRYNARNKWNASTVNGAMHLVQQNNTLSAEIELAAGASNARSRNGQLLTDATALIKCGAYGQPERHSDPSIGAIVNGLARANADITLANPVGIYFDSLSTAGWRTPDGSNPGDFWKIVRGTPQKPVRAVFEVPAGKGFLVEDITINGLSLRYGGQIADFITMKLTGVAARVGQSIHPPLDGCKRRKQMPTAAVGGIDVAAVLARSKITTR